MGRVRLYRGSTVKSYSGKGVTLFVAADLTKLTGVAYSVTRHTVLCCNGDPEQAAGYSDIYAVQNNAGVIANCSKSLTGMHRINWIVAVSA